MAVHIIIPARYGSTRFPGKALLMLAGKPMVQHIWERARQVPDIASVTVATDDQRIAEVITDLGGQTIMTDPDLRSGSDRVAAAARQMKLASQEIVVNLQGDQPGIDPRLITQTVAPMLADSTLEMTTPVHPMRQEPSQKSQPPDYNWVKVVTDRQYNALYFSRAPIPWPRDGEAATYLRHIGLYVFRKSLLDIFAQLPTGYLEDLEKLEQLRILEAGHKIRCVLTDIEVREINSPQDIPEVVERL